MWYTGDKIQVAVRKSTFSSIETSNEIINNENQLIGIQPEQKSMLLEFFFFAVSPKNSLAVKYCRGIMGINTFRTFSCYVNLTYNIVSPVHSFLVEPSFINHLKPAGHVMHQQFNIRQLYVLPTLYLCVLYLSENKQRLVPLTA